jgi:ADP-ribose pyrophosphatase YjhB (NUDIX family)
VRGRRQRGKTGEPVFANLTAKLIKISNTSMKIDSTWYQRPVGIAEQTSAGGVVVRVESNRVFLALAAQKGRSKFVLPKGRVEDGESLEAAAVREIEEETGLSGLKLLVPLGAKERLDFRKTVWKKTHYFLFITNQIDGLPTDAKYHDEAKWFPLEAFPDLLWPEQTQLIRENLDKIKDAALRFGKCD